MSGPTVLAQIAVLPPAMKELEPGTVLIVQIAPAIKKVAVLVQLGLTVHAGEAVVLLPKDSKLVLVLLQAVILSLDAWMTAHASPLLFLI